MSWNDLSMKDRASYIRMGVENGITDLGTIREVYNKFAEGGNLNTDDNPKKRTYDHNKGVYYVEGQDAPNNLIYSLDEFTQEQINEINSKYNKGWKTDKKGNVIFNNITGTPLNADLRKSFAMYDGAYQLPSVTVTPDGNYTELVPNELNTGWMYRDRAGRFNDIDYSYLDKYLGNKKSLGGNLHGDGGDNTPLVYDLSKTVEVSPEQQAERLVSLGNGVYKDKVSNKLLYNYDEMPTATVVGNKKKKSVNDNWQAAYAKGIPSGTMSADMETMNAVTGGAMNLLSPSQIVGAAIHSDRPQDYFLNLMKGNNGIVTDEFAQEHPYLSMGANMLFDGITLGAGFNGRGLAKSVWNSNLRYELDPRYMRVYHHSPKPFDIDNFNVATGLDAGLHVSPYPDYRSGFGSVIYKGYAKKPSFEFFDRGSNGFRMFLPINKEHTISLLKTDSPLTKRYLKATYSPKSLKNLRLTPLTDSKDINVQLNIRDIPSKYVKKYEAPRFNLGLEADNNVDAIDLIFPNESRTFKEGLRKITNSGIDRFTDALSKPSLSMDEINKIDNYNIGVNQQISDFLSSNGYSVGEYPNNNLSEKFPQSFSIFDRNAVHNWKRIRKLGGSLAKSDRDSSRQISEDGYPIYELPEVEVTAEPYYKKFLNSLPQPVQQYLQNEANNAILARQAGSIDNPSYGTISKEDAQRNKRNYFDVQALNTAMGSPYVMNQNSFNYNPNIANQQLQYGANYPMSTIENAFEMGLGDAALDYALKGVPIALDKLGFFVRKPDSFTRGIGQTTAGLKDLQRSGVIRGNPYGTEVSANVFAKYYRGNREQFKDIIDLTGDQSIAQKWYSKSLSKDEFYKLRDAEIKIRSKQSTSTKTKSRFNLSLEQDFVKQFDSYDDYLKYLEQSKRPTSVDDTGEALAYFYDDGRNPLTAGYDYSASNYGVRVNNASSYNPRIFNGHLHYSFPQAVKLSDPNVEVFRNVKLGPFNITRRMNKNDILRGKFALGGHINTRTKHKNGDNSQIGLYYTEPVPNKLHAGWVYEDSPVYTK